MKHSEEDREVIRKELRYNKHEYLDSYFNLAKATDERLKEMSDKVEATNEERDKNIKKDMQQLKNRYDDVNSQLGSRGKENGHNEQKSGRKFVCNTGEIGCNLEKFYLTRKTGSGSHARHQS